MKKGKALSVLIAALMIAALAISCNGNIEAPAEKAEEMSYITFGSGNSRDLSTSYMTEDYDALYWFYTANKLDAYGTTGATDAQKPVSVVNDVHQKGLIGRVGPFSQGKWEFELFAYSPDSTGAAASDNLVYQGKTSNVVLKGSEVKSVPVSVSTKGDVGYVKFSDAYFRWLDSTDSPAGQGGGASAPKMEITLTPVSGSKIVNEIALTPVYDGETFMNRFNVQNGLSIKRTVNETVLENVPQGYYTAKAIVYLKDTVDGVEIDNKGTPLFSQTFGLRVYGNATTFISGNMVEGVDTTVSFEVPEQEMIVFNANQNGSASFDVAIAPNGNDNTTVTFPENALASSSVHQLDVAVTPIASAEQRFQISGTTQQGKTAVAGIDLNLVKIEHLGDGTTVQTPVETFGKDAQNQDNKVRIETFIEPGLSSVSVLYLKDGEYSSTGISDIDYVAGTGELTFYTTHFSQYVVVGQSVVFDSVLNRGYATLKDAFDNAIDGSTIVLQEINESKELVVNEQIVSTKDITLDMNGITIKNTADIWVDTEYVSNWSSISVQGGCLTITGNGAILAKENDNFALDVRNGAKLIVENGTFTGNISSVYCYEGEVEIKGGAFGIQQLSSGKPYGFVINCYDDSYRNGTAKVTITGGRFQNYNPSASVSESPAANFCPDGYGALLNSDGWYEVIRPESKIGSTFYRTLGDAIEAVEEDQTITMVNDVEHAPGLSVNKSVDFTIDFNGHEYTLDNPGAGSSGTKTNGFQMLKGSVSHTVTFKNGTINVSENNRSIMRIFQNYSGLVLEDMTIDGRNQYGGASYVMSLNHDPVFIKGNTNIIAAEGSVAFDADGNWGGYNRCKVTIDTTGTITGNIEVGQGYLTVLNGNVKGGIVLCRKCGQSETAGQADRISVKGGTFKIDPSEYVAAGYSVIENSNGTYSVTEMPKWIEEETLEENDGVYEINSPAQLARFAYMVNSEKNRFSGKTVKLTADIDLGGKIWIPVGQTGATQFMGTFDGDNHTIKNMVVINADVGGNCSSGLFGWLNAATVKNVKLENPYVSGHHNVGVIAGYMETAGCTIDNCHVNNATVICESANNDANGDKVGGIVGHAGNNGVIVKKCTVTNSSISAGRDAGQVAGAAKTANVSECSAVNVTVVANGTSTGANIREEVIGREL